MGTVAKVLNIYKEEGWLVVVGRGLKKIVCLLFETNSAFWFERDLSLSLPEITPKIPVEINLFSKDETLDWLRNSGEPWMFKQRELDIGLVENHHFPNIKYQNKVIGYAKVGQGRVYIQDYKKALNLHKNTAFIYDTYVSPEYRGLKIAPFLITEIMKFLKSNGARRVGCHIPTWNAVSINAYTKVGFKKTKYIRYFKIFGLKFLSSNPQKLVETDEKRNRFRTFNNCIWYI